MTYGQYQKVNIYVFGVPDGEEKVIHTRKLFEEIMTDNFLNVMWCKYKYTGPRSSMNPKQVNQIKPHWRT